MLATLYAKALDADALRSILGDQHAKAAVARINYDWEATGINARQAPSVAIRTLHFDDWTRQFLAVHEEVTVLHVGCGLDARVHRLDPPAGVRWYDIDYPEVIGLRERGYPGRANYRMLAASVTDPSWLAEIPADSPALLVGEGLTPYQGRRAGAAASCRRSVPFGRTAVRCVQYVRDSLVAAQQPHRAPLGFEAALGDQRARRHRRRGSGGPSFGLAIGIRQPHIRFADAREPLVGQGDGCSSAIAEVWAVPPLRIRAARDREALSAGRCCTNHLRLRRNQPWPTGKS